MAVVVAPKVAGVVDAPNRPGDEEKEKAGVDTAPPKPGVEVVVVVAPKGEGEGAPNVEVPIPGAEGAEKLKAGVEAAPKAGVEA